MVPSPPPRMAVRPAPAPRITRRVPVTPGLPGCCGAWAKAGAHASVAQKNHPLRRKGVRSWRVLFIGLFLGGCLIVCHHSALGGARHLVRVPESVSRVTASIGG